MNLSKLLLFIFLVFDFISCKQDLQVVFPDIPKLEQRTQNNEYTTIIYVDSSGQCTPCSLKHLNSWKAYQKTLEKYKTNILLVVNYSNEQYFIEALKTVGVFDFVLDQKSAFRILNDKIFRSAYDGIFVIDKNKNVIFTDSPIKNEQTWGKFMKIVKQ